MCYFQKLVSIILLNNFVIIVFFVGLFEIKITRFVAVSGAHVGNLNNMFILCMFMVIFFMSNNRVSIIIVVIVVVVVFLIIIVS